MLSNTQKAKTVSYEFVMRDQSKLKITLVNNCNSIDQNAARSILINSFIGEYSRYLEPAEIDAKLQCWFKSDGANSVEEYYSDYFHNEFEEFQKGNLFWVEATIDNQLVGWATYERDKEPSNSCYMNLLVVDPKFNHRGIGKQLVIAVQELKLLPQLQYINLLLRKKNQGGRLFYSKLGFNPNPEFKRANFVDTALLEGWTLELAKLKARSIDKPVPYSKMSLIKSKP